jgi:predicted DNA-binding transcriptional regulator YafY
MLRLRGGRVVTANDLASSFEVSVRTIYRDIEALSALGVPIFAERGRVGGFKLLDGYFLPALAFTVEEAVSLMLGVTMLRSLRVRPYATALDNAERKLLAAMPEHLSAMLSEAQRFIGFEPAPESVFQSDSDISDLQDPPSDSERAAIDTFFEAVLAGNQVRMLYRSPYRASNDEVLAAPFAVFCDRQRWYLAGELVERPGSTHLWRADRVLRIERMREHASEDSTFDVRSLLGRAWLRNAMLEWSRTSPVRIRLSSSMVERVQQDWYYRHASFDHDGDGSVVMSFGEDRREHVFELLRWLGPGAELLEPEGWRREFIDELIKMVEAYRAPTIS